MFPANFAEDWRVSFPIFCSTHKDCGILPFAITRWSLSYVPDTHSLTIITLFHIFIIYSLSNVPNFSPFPASHYKIKSRTTICMCVSMHHMYAYIESNFICFNSIIFHQKISCFWVCHFKKKMRHFILISSLCVCFLFVSSSKKILCWYMYCVCFIFMWSVLFHSIPFRSLLHIC